MPKVGGVGAVFILILYVFTLLGNTLFPYIRTQKYLNGVDLQFRTFSGSIISLIRVASGEQWFNLVGDIARERAPNFPCVPISNYEGFIEHGNQRVWLSSLSPSLHAPSSSLVSQY